MDLYFEASQGYIRPFAVYHSAVPGAGHQGVSIFNGLHYSLPWLVTVYAVSLIYLFIWTSLSRRWML